MIKFSLISKNKTSIWRDVNIIDSKDIISWDYSLNLDSPHEIKMVISPTFQNYDLLFKATTGIRLKTLTGIDLIFQKIGGKVLERGEYEINLASSVYDLAFAPLKYSNINYSGSLETFLNNLSADYVFTKIGDDTNLEIETGFLNNYEKMNESAKYPFFYSWCEIGVKEVVGQLKTEILYGDFRELPAFYSVNSGDYPQLKPLFASEEYSTDEAVTVSNIELVEQDFDFNHVVGYMNTGSGSAEDTIVTLNPNGDYIRSGFPVVTIDGVNYVRDDSKYLDGEIKIKVYSPEGSSATEDPATNEIDTAQAEKILYSKTVSYLQSFGAGFYYNVDFDTSRLILPGIPITINFKLKQNNIDKTNITLYNINNNIIIPKKITGDGNTTLK